MKSRPIYILVFLFTLLFACTNPPDYPIEPEIEFLRLSKDTMNQSSNINVDSLLVTIGFTDGDGDIGHDTLKSIVVIDTRQNFPTENIIPDIREAKIPVSKGISGEISFVLRTTCCIYENGEFPCRPSVNFPIDTVVYDVYILDRAGNKSNTVELPPIYLRCNN